MQSFLRFFIILVCFTEIACARSSRLAEQSTEQPSLVTTELTPTPLFPIYRVTDVGKPGIPKLTIKQLAWLRRIEALPHYSKQLVSPTIMSYCSPYRLGAYNRSVMLATLAASAEAQPSRSAAPFGGAIALFAGMEVPRRDAISLDYSYTAFEPVRPIKPGPVFFQGFDENGREIISASSAVGLIGDFTSHPEEVSEIGIPITRHLERHLSSIRVTYRGLTDTRKALPGGPITADVSAIDATHLKVTFDCSHFTELRIYEFNSRDTAKFSKAPVYCDAPIVERSDRNVSDVYIDFEDGVKTVAHLVKFHVKGR